MSDLWKYKTPWWWWYQHSRGHIRDERDYWRRRAHQEENRLARLREWVQDGGLHGDDYAEFMRVYEGRLPGAPIDSHLALPPEWAVSTTNKEK